MEIVYCTRVCTVLHTIYFHVQSKQCKIFHNIQISQISTQTTHTAQNRNQLRASRNAQDVYDLDVHKNGYEKDTSYTVTRTLIQKM